MVKAPTAKASTKTTTTLHTGTKGDSINNDDDDDDDAFDDVDAASYYYNNNSNCKDEEEELGWSHFLRLSAGSSSDSTAAQQWLQDLVHQASVQKIVLELHKLWEESRTKPRLGLLIVAVLVVAWNIVGEVRHMQQPLAMATASDKKVSTTTALFDLEEFQSRQLQASVGLRVMEAANKLTTPFTSRENVIANGFPLPWEPCVLEAIFQQRDTVRVALVGGSTAARPGNDCGHDGRYSALLQEKLNTEAQSTTATGGHNHTLKFEITNYAQGGTNSITSGLLMDEFIHPNTTDVIIWEFLVNDDSASGGVQEQARKLDFWLTRIHAIYFDAGGVPPPPILLLFLWPYGPRSYMTVSYKASLDRHPLNYHGRLIGKYNKLGWNIAAMNVGKVVDVPKVRSNPALLLDDTNHPSCHATHLIADMLQHAIYTNLADNQQQSCTVEKLSNATAATSSTTTSMIPLPHKQTWPTGKAAYKELWQDMFHPNAKIGSVSGWFPQYYNEDTNSNKHQPQRMSGLNITNIHRMQNWTKMLLEKADEGRADRKYGFLLPHCSATTSSAASAGLQLEIHEPDLKWIGLFAVGPRISITANGVPLKAPPLKGWSYGATQVSHWLSLHNNTVPKANTYTIQLCQHRSAPKSAHVHFLVGVSVPPSSSEANYGNGETPMAND